MTTLPPFWFELKHGSCPVASNNVDDLLFSEDRSFLTLACVFVLSPVEREAMILEVDDGTGNSFVRVAACAGHQRQAEAAAEVIASTQARPS